jgi:uncharacterized phage protein (TIGR02216 family)
MIPWDAWMAHGIGGLRIAPETFWRLSVREWRCVLGEGRGGALTRAELDILLKEHPDVPE